VTIQQVAESWEHPDWPANLSELRHTRDLTECPSGKYTKPYRLQEFAWLSQAKAGTDLIGSITGLRRHIPEGFTWCSPAFYSPSIIIELAELVHRQPRLADLPDISRVARNLRQILGMLGPSASSCNFVNNKRKDAPLFSFSMALEEAFKSWEDRAVLPPHTSEWKPGSSSTLMLRQAQHHQNFQNITHTLAWLDLVRRHRVCDSPHPKVSNTLHWDLLAMVVAQIEPTLKPYNTTFLRSILTVSRRGL